ncbi:hypothetical protein [Vallitalea guaymasensis]|uniref:hypothetical protein n=1 Tax=Vallitalea guaymasensis TaxID=1185412 RepID=UPI000DE1AEF7|nr:hypothetical protein [Vallitalea guaymasensis]
MDEVISLWNKTPIDILSIAYENSGLYFTCVDGQIVQYDFEPVQGYGWDDMEFVKFLLCEVI